jgi:uncharacterized membrane protein YfhO
VNYEPEHVIIQAQSNASGYLILTDTFYPGWVATVDGEQKEITQAFGLFRAVEIGAGSHTVEFRFEPMSLKVGAIISIASMMVLMGLLTYAARKM